MLMTITYLQLCFNFIIQLNHISGEKNELKNHLQQNQTISTFLKSLNQNYVIDKSNTSINYHVNQNETRYNSSCAENKELAEKDNKISHCNYTTPENEINVIKYYDNAKNKSDLKSTPNVSQIVAQTCDECYEDEENVRRRSDYI
ncbi:unnamed protein product [Schistosoma turkestanicum]|nr:unnamed protein product [Schistosoma turkestanicum]